MIWICAVCGYSKVLFRLTWPNLYGSSTDWGFIFNRGISYFFYEKLLWVLIRIDLARRGNTDEYKECKFSGEIEKYTDLDTSLLRSCYHLIIKYKKKEETILSKRTSCLVLHQGDIP